MSDKNRAMSASSCRDILMTFPAPSWEYNTVLLGTLAVLSTERSNKTSGVISLCDSTWTLTWHLNFTGNFLNFLLIYQTNCMHLALKKRVYRTENTSETFRVT